MKGDASSAKSQRRRVTEGDECRFLSIPGASPAQAQASGMARGACTLNWSSSSCAINLLRALTYLSTTGCLNIRSTATTTDFCALSLTTVPRSRSLASQGAVLWKPAAAAERCGHAARRAPVMPPQHAVQAPCATALPPAATGKSPGRYAAIESPELVRDKFSEWLPR